MVVSGTVFSWGRVRGQPVPCRFCGAPDYDGHLFGECTFPLLVEIRENPEFHDLMGMDKAHWPRCLLWHGSGVNGVSPCAAETSESAVHLFEVALGRYSPGVLADWSPSDGFDAVEAASRVPDAPEVWTNGSLVLDQVTGVSSSGAGFFAHQSEDFWGGRRWGQVDRVRPEGEVQSCRGFCSVPGPLQSVQRAEMWGIILALQSADALHLGVDVVVPLLSSLPLMVIFFCSLTGCFVFEVLTRFGLPRSRVMLRRLWFLTVRFVRLTGLVITLLMRLLTLVVEGLVLLSLMRVVTCLGYVFGGILSFLIFIVSSLPPLGLLSTMTRVMVLLLIPRYCLLVLSLRGFGWFMRFETGPCCPDHLLSGSLNGSACLLLLSVLMTLVIGPFLLVFWLSGLLFWATLHWPVGGVNLGVGGISYVELLILYELWAGERLSLEEAHPRYLRPGRPISESAVPCVPGTDIWRSCRFIGAMMRSL